MGAYATSPDRNIETTKDYPNGGVSSDKCYEDPQFKGASVTDVVPAIAGSVNQIEVALA